MKRRVAWGGLIAVVLLAAASSAAASEQETYYLGPDGVPRGPLLLNPLGGEMPNYDRGRDVEPGLLLERSERGLEETDERRFQHWQIQVGGQTITGHPSMVVWSAAERFERDRKGVFTAFILDCDSTGSRCTELAKETATIDSGSGATWVETTIDFTRIDHHFGEGRHLGVRIVVDASSETNLMFAYGYPAQRSRLTFYPDPLSPAVHSAVLPREARITPQDIEVSSSDSAATVAVSEPEPAAATWAPWLLTMFISTVLLATLGGALLSSLTRTGRHQGPSDTADGEEAQTRRISVSAN